LQTAWRRGAIHGAAAGQAFYLTCDAVEPADGSVALELGLALRQPADYRVVSMVMRTGSSPR
jgi:hypothetical protein